MSNAETTLENQIVDKRATDAIIELASTNKHQAYKEKIANKVDRQIGKKATTLVETAMELAQGITVAEEDEEGGVKYYTKAPNLNAIIYLLDRLMGKPVAKQEIKEEKKGIFIIEHMIKQLADKPVVTVPATEVKNENDGQAKRSDPRTVGQPVHVPAG